MERGEVCVWGNAGMWATEVVSIYDFGMYMYVRCIGMYVAYQESGQLNPLKIPLSPLSLANPSLLVISI